MFGDNLHHFYLLEGGHSVAKLAYEELSKVTGLDVEQQEKDSLNIDEARVLRKDQSFSQASNRAVLILSVGSITAEAQNALLKSLEEPVPGKHVVLVLESLSSLIQPLLSRAEIVSTKSINYGTADDKAVRFLKADLLARRKLLFDLTKRETESDKKQDQRRAAIAFMKDLEQAISEYGDHKAMKQVLEARLYLESRELSTPQVIEATMLALETVV